MSDPTGDPTYGPASEPASDDEGALSDAELRALRDRARDTGDESLRRLVASYLTLRRLAADVVTFIETREGAMTVVRTPLFVRLRDLTRRS